MNFIQRFLSMFRKNKNPVPTGNATLDPAQPNPVYTTQPAIPVAAPVPSAPVASVGPTVGSSDPGAPFGRNNYGMPFASQADADAYKKALAEHDANQAQIDQMMKTETYHGPLSVKDVTDAEMDFLFYASHNYVFPKAKYQGEVIYAVLGGTLAEINLKINQADGRASKSGAVPAGTDRVKGYVDSYAQGQLPVNVTH